MVERVPGVSVRARRRHLARHARNDGRLPALKAETLVITGAGHPSIKHAAFAGKARSIVVPARLVSRGARPMDLFTPIPYIVPAQILSAYLAVEKGLDPDRPRTLTKVTRTL